MFGKENALRLAKSILSGKPSDDKNLIPLLLDEKVSLVAAVGKSREEFELRQTQDEVLSTVNVPHLHQAKCSSSCIYL